MPAKAKGKRGLVPITQLEVAFDVTITNNISKVAKVHEGAGWPDLHNRMTVGGGELLEACHKMNVDTISHLLRRSLPREITNAQAQLHNVAAGPVVEKDEERVPDLVWKVALAGKGQTIVLGDYHEQQGGLFKLLFGVSPPPLPKKPAQALPAASAGSRPVGALGKRKVSKVRNLSDSDDDDADPSPPSPSPVARAPSKKQIPLFVVQVEAASKDGEPNSRVRLGGKAKPYTVSLAFKSPHRRDGHAKNNSFTCEDKTLLGECFVISSQKMEDLRASSEWGGEDDEQTEDSCRTYISRSLKIIPNS